MIIVKIVECSNDKLPNNLLGEMFNTDLDKSSIKLGEYTTPSDKKVVFYNYMDNKLILSVSNDIVVSVISLNKVDATTRVLQDLKSTPYQVVKVYTMRDYRGQGITTKAYELAITNSIARKKAICIQSGVHQTYSIARVWNKLAINSATSNFEVNIIDKGALRYKSDGTVATYKGMVVPDKNTWSLFPDKDIWSIYPDAYKKDTFLVLRQKTQGILL